MPLLVENLSFTYRAGIAILAPIVIVLGCMLMIALLALLMPFLALYTMVIFLFFPRQANLFVKTVNPEDYDV